MVRSDDWAEPSLAARREASRLGIAIAAMMPIIATTMRSSINEKPSWRLVVILVWCSLRDLGVPKISRATGFRHYEPRKARSTVDHRTTSVPIAVWLKSAKKRSFLIEIFAGLR